MHTHNTTPHQHCRHCGQDKPATTEYFYRDTTRSSGLYPKCKACIKAYQAANRDRIREQRRSFRAANRTMLNERSRNWRADNPERVAENNRLYSPAYYQANRERILAAGRTNPHRAEYNRAWRAANPDRIIAQRRAYSAANKDKLRNGWRRRRALKLAAQGRHTAADVQRQYDAQRGKCYYCGIKVGNDYHVDHVIPLSRGGSNGPENIVIACAPCNMSKHNKLPSEWSQGGRLI